MPLQTALDRNKMTITGRNVGFEDLLAAAEEQYSGDPQKLAKLRALELTITPAERTRLENKAGLPAPDHTHIVVVNGSGEQATIRLNQAIVLSADKETLPELPLGDLASSNRNPKEIQREIWKKVESVHEAELAAVGFPVGEGTGSPDVLKASVREFQDSEDLPQKDGQIDSATEQFLSVLASNERSLDIINNRPNASYVARNGIGIEPLSRANSDARICPTSRLIRSTSALRDLCPSSRGESRRTIL